MNNLVSIIIPNFNREHLIAETLDSIITQSHKNWECIIVDDGSTDRSVETVQSYVQNDKRFTLLERPIDYPKGANACRNIGMKRAKGDYVIFFDSDDLMLENHVKHKLHFVVENKLDFAMFKTMNFGNIREEEKYIDYSVYEHYKITADNYLLNKFRIFTLDLIISKHIIDKCTFYYKNESALENVLMTQIVLLTENCAFDGEILSMRRCHSDNITESLAKDQDKILEHLFFFYYNILDYIHELNASQAAKKFVLDQLIYFYRKINFKLDIPFSEFLLKIIKLKSPKHSLGLLNKRYKKALGLNRK